MAESYGSSTYRRASDRGVDVALVTCRELPEPDPDAAPLETSLSAAGVSAAWRAWDDADVDWRAARLSVLRSCWNYPPHAAAFRDWVQRVATASALWNPAPVVRWNLHKGYLLDLERRGVAVAPTELVRRDEPAALATIRRQRGWETVVIKPAVSAASYRTARFGPADDDAGQQHLQALAADGDVLVQAYLPSVEDHGERALIWVEGELTHAIRKTPRFAGEHEAVSTAAVPIAPAEAELARAAVAAVAAPLLYARVDMAPGPDGGPRLMELELIEPSLFFTQGERALERFVAGIRRRLDQVAGSTTTAVP